MRSDDDNGWGSTVQMEEAGASVGGTTTSNGGGAGDTAGVVVTDFDFQEGDKEVMPRQRVVSCVAFTVVGTSSIFGASMNMFNSVIGVGIVTLPTALRRSGLYIGFLLALVSCALSYYTCYLMIRAVVEYKKKGGLNITTYGQYCREGIGSWGFYFSTIANYLMMHGVMVVYCILFRVLLTELISECLGQYFEHGKLVLLAVGLVVMAPLSVIKDMSKLAWSSSISTFSVLAIISIVAIRAPVYHNEMVNLTPAEMLQNSKSLHFDKSIWICDLVNSQEDTQRDPYDGHLDSWNVKTGMEHVRVDYSGLWNTLENDQEKSCSIPVNTDRVLSLVDASHVNATSSLESAFAEHIFNRYSINDEGAKRENFEVHSFIRGGFMVSFGVISAAYMAQMSVFSIYPSLARPNLRSWNLTLVSSFAGVFVACSVIALSGYFSAQYQCGDFVFTPMVARYFGMEFDFATNAGRILLVLTISLTFPMMMFFARKNLIQLVDQFQMKFGLKVREEPSNIMFYGITFFMWSSAILMGMFVDDVFFVYALLGALCAAPLLYILPVLGWFGLNGGMKYTLKQAGSGDWIELLRDAVLPVCVLSMGTLAMIFSTTMTLTQKFGITNF